jgi:hypothetical protein
LRPVAGFRPARSGVDTQDRPHAILRTAEHDAEFGLGHGGFGFVELLLCFLESGGIPGFQGKIQKNGSILHLGSDAPVKLVGFLGLVKLFGQDLGLVGIVPKIGLDGLSFDLLNPLFLGGDVKDASGRFRVCFAALRRGFSALST